MNHSNILHLVLIACVWWSIWNLLDLGKSIFVFKSKTIDALIYIVMLCITISFLQKLKLDNNY